MQKRWYFLIVICIALSCFGVVLAKPCPLEPPPTGPQLFTLPAGTLLPVVLIEEVSTATGAPGQSVSAIVAQDMYLGTKKVINRNDQVYGTITQLEPPFKGRNAILKIEFNTLMLSTGARLSLSTLTDTGSDNHTYGGELTSGTRPEIIPYNVYMVGTYGRVLLSGPRAMGEHVVLKPGNRLVLILQEPVTLYGY